MEKTFRKRPGTTNMGSDYEPLNIANIAINLVADEKVKIFYISSNDADFGDFDDVVVETERENGTEIIALQLKHSDRGNLCFNQLTAAKGDFSIKKYYASCQTMEVNPKCILYTNLKLQEPKENTFYLLDEYIPMTVTKMSNNPFKILEETNYCYSFSVVDGLWSYDYSPEVLLYKRFLDNFYLYTDQKNRNILKSTVNDKFKAIFCGNDLECNEYVNFLIEWSLKDGKKKEKLKLNKKWVKQAITLKILQSRIKPLVFNSNNNNQQVGVRRNILRKAIEVFDITIFGKKSYDELRSLWSDTKCELQDFETAIKFKKKYPSQFNFTCVPDIAKLEPVTLSILFWLMGKCPLILGKQDESVQKALELCIGEKFILLTENANSLTENTVMFKTLSDLRTKTCEYNQLIQNFTCSLQGKEKICLENLIKNEEEILNFFNTDDLLEMCDGQYNIGETKENLLEPYIERCLLKNAVDFKVLNNIPEETIIILDCVPQNRDLQSRLGRYNLIKINDYLDEDKDETLSQSNEKKSYAKFSPRTTIYLSEKKCEYSQFHAVCNKIENAKHFHQFRVRDEGNLEWIRSKGDVSDIEKCKLSEYYLVDECDLGSSEFEHNINLLISDPGMGKSQLMKSFRNNCHSESFTIIVNSQDVYSFLNNLSHSNNYENVLTNFLSREKYKELSYWDRKFLKENNIVDEWVKLLGKHATIVTDIIVELFRNFLADEKYKKHSDRDRDILLIFLKKNKIVYVWDALDELLDEHRNIVTNIIVELSKECVQWVTSRCHLQNILQSKFKVPSLTLNKFNKQEQESYIQKRLANNGSSSDDIKITINKIESSFVLVEHKDILGIPLQIFMLTELFRQDPKKYLALMDNFFLLTDLYDYFIKEKLNIYNKDKASTVVNTASAQKAQQIINHELLKECTNAALRLLFADSILTELGIQQKQTLQVMHESHTNIGLVTEVKNQTPRFLHNSFAEYLAACYLANEFENKEVLPRVMFDPKYINVRFFFDLLFAKDRKAHVAILYRDFSSIKSCSSDNLKRTDAGGRSVLHLACSWGKRYPELNIKHIKDTYIVDDEGKFSAVPDKKEYLEAIDHLLKTCDISKSDTIYMMTPEAYARKTTCLAAEMRIMMEMKQNIGKSIKDDHIINMLYYSAYYGFYGEFTFFWGVFKQNFAEQGDRTTTLQLSRSIINKIKNKAEMTLLYIAATMGHIKIVEFLIRARADINLPSSNGFTPLHAASEKGYDEIVGTLIKAGAKVNHLDKYGFTALNTASANGHNKIVAFLVQKGASINLANNDGDTPLHTASSQGNYEIVEFLVGARADVNVRNNFGVTPLNAASGKGHYKIVELLIANGADINISNEYDFTPIISAAANGHHEIIELLIEAGAKLN